jgi:hypothetical protein
MTPTSAIIRQMKAAGISPEAVLRARAAQRQADRQFDADIARVMQDSLRRKGIVFALLPLPTAEVIEFRPMPKFLRGGPNFGSAA